LSNTVLAVEFPKSEEFLDYMSHNPLMKNVPCDVVSEDNQLHVARSLHVAALQQFRDECVWF
jgi:hypothetical protein